MGIESREQVVILQKDNHLRIASPQVQQERDLVLWAETKGCLDILTESQRPVIEERYLSQRDVVLSFGLVKQKSEENGTRITRAALHFANRNAITKLERVSKGEPIRRRRRTKHELELNIKKGRPRKNIVQ